MHSIVNRVVWQLAACLLFVCSAVMPAWAFPPSLSSAIAYADSLYQEDLTQEAIVAYRRAVGSPLFLAHADEHAKAKVYVDLARAYKEAGSTAQAIDAYRAAVQLYPQEPIWINALGHLYYHRGIASQQLQDFQQAYFYFDKAVQLDAASSRYYTGRGCAAFVIYQKLAVPALLSQFEMDTNKALELDPKGYSARFNLAVVLAEKGGVARDTTQLMQAYRHYEVLASTYYGESVEIMRNQAGVLASMGEVTGRPNYHMQAIAYYRRCQALTSSCVNDAFKIARQQVAIGALTGKEEHFDQAVALGDSVLQSGEYSYQTLRSHMSLQLLLCITTHRQEYALHGIKEVKQLLKEQPNNAALYFAWGNFLSELAKITRDVRWHKDAASKHGYATTLAPDNTVYYYNLAYSLSHIGKWTKDKTYLHKSRDAAQEGVDRGGQVYNLACSYSLLQDKERAMALLAQSFERMEVTVEAVLQDEDWFYYLSDADFRALIERYQGQPDNRMHEWSAGVQLLM